MVWWLRCGGLQLDSLGPVTLRTSDLRLGVVEVVVPCVSEKKGAVLEQESLPFLAVLLLGGRTVATTTTTTTTTTTITTTTTTTATTKCLCGRTGARADHPGTSLLLRKVELVLQLLPARSEPDRAGQNSAGIRRN